MAASDFWPPAILGACDSWAAAKRSFRTAPVICGTKGRFRPKSLWCLIFYRWTVIKRRFLVAVVFSTTDHFHFSEALARTRPDAKWCERNCRWLVELRVRRKRAG